MIYISFYYSAGIALKRGVVMTVLLRSPSRLSVVLTGEDMARLGVTYDGFDPASARRAVIAVLDETCGAEAVDFLRNGLTVETLPGRENGCIIVISAGTEPTEGYICLFPDRDAFLDCAGVLIPFPGEAELYRSENRFFLFFGDPALLPVLTEYGEVLRDRGGYALARIREYGEKMNFSGS